MSAKDSRMEDYIQGELDKSYGTPGQFGQRRVDAGVAEADLRRRGILPEGWRLRDSGSTSSGFRPTQAATKKMGAIRAGALAGGGMAAFGAAGMGPLAGAFGGGGGAAPVATAPIQGAAAGGALPSTAVGTGMVGGLAPTVTPALSTGAGSSLAHTLGMKGIEGAMSRMSRRILPQQQQQGPVRRRKVKH